MIDSESALTDQQQSFVRFYCTGLSAPHAAKQAGYKPSYCRKASRLLKHPAIKEAIEENQTALRESQGYGQEQAVAELDRLIRGALSGKHPAHMAAANLMGLKLKVFGLIKDRVEIIPLDLRGALEQARHRVLDVTSRQPCGDDVAITGGAHWPIHVPGDSVATNSE